jgi:alkylhydroperoxidase family enzyme
MAARIKPPTTPFGADIQDRLNKVMPSGIPPLLLFTTLARDPRLFHKFFDAGLLDRGNLTLRQREIVIARTTALCGSEYEWGVHMTFFSNRVGMDDVQIRSLVNRSSSDACWSDQESCLLQLCDALHANCDIDDGLWEKLGTYFGDSAMLELLMLAGFYRTVSYLTNALKLPLESYAARFPVRSVL